MKYYILILCIFTLTACVDRDCCPNNDNNFLQISFIKSNFDSTNCKLLNNPLELYKIKDTILLVASNHIKEKIVAIISNGEVTLTLIKNPNEILSFSKSEPSWFNIQLKGIPENRKMLSDTIIYFSDFDGDKKLDLIINDHYHNGTYNAVYQRVFDVDRSNNYLNYKYSVEFKTYKDDNYLEWVNVGGCVKVYMTQKNHKKHIGCLDYKFTNSALKIEKKEIFESEEYVLPKIE